MIHIFHSFGNTASLLELTHFLQSGPLLFVLCVSQIGYQTNLLRIFTLTTHTLWHPKTTKTKITTLCPKRITLFTSQIPITIVFFGREHTITRRLLLTSQSSIMHCDTITSVFPMHVSKGYEFPPTVSFSNHQMSQMVTSDFLPSHPLSIGVEGCFLIRPHPRLKPAAFLLLVWQVFQICRIASTKT